jgi:protein arginine kinase activator
MNCERCNAKPAQVQFTEVVGGAKKVQWLCTSCASAHGALWATDPVPKLGTPTVASSGSKAPAPRRRCGGCGTTLSAIRRTGRVGCPECYTTFRSHLDPLMNRVHRSLRHVGRIPALRRPAADLRRLKEELAAAVAAEDFEAAARLRDAIAGAETGPADAEEAP